MKAAAALILLGAVCASGSPDDLQPPISGIHFQRTNLVVRWNGSKHPWPKALWVYRVTPTRFSPTTISNLMVICSVKETDKTDYGTNGMVFSPADGPRNLRISFPEGSIEYWSTHSYGPSNLATKVPGRDQLFSLTEALLKKLGISISDIAKANRTGKPKMSIFESPVQYFLDHTVVTNVESRSVRLNRALDGVEFGGDGGNCEIEFGAHGQVTKLSLSWRNVEREKSYRTVPPRTIIKRLREGKAVHAPVMDEFGNDITIDWSRVCNLTVKRAQAYYWGKVYPVGVSPVFPSRLIPYAILLAKVDTGTSTFDVAIQCPIFEEEHASPGKK